MKKKFINLNKDIEDSKNDIMKLNDSISNLKKEIEYYENKLFFLRKEVFIQIINIIIKILYL